MEFFDMEDDRECALSGEPCLCRGFNMDKPEPEGWLQSVRFSEAGSSILKDREHGS
jgi:hypothetical protein